jgi:uncharacterized protein (TIGR03435 family)
MIAWRIQQIRLWIVMVAAVAAAVVFLGMGEGWAQNTISVQQSTIGGKRLEFDVASVRQNKSGDKPTSTFSLDNGNVYSTVGKGDVFTPPGGYFSATNQPLWRYISFAYNLSGTQELAMRFGYFSGLPSKLPAWVVGSFDAQADKFDITARSAGQPTKDEMRLMMQSLLADRFGLAAHFETREAPVFAMVLAKIGSLGPNLKPHDVSDTCEVECGVLGRLTPSAPGMVRIGGRGIPLALFATSLPTQTGMAVVGRPVIDRTGLTGTYDLTLEWAGMLNGQPNPVGPTFDEALRNQLGLKFVSDKGPVKVLVIDRVERPSAN